MKSEKKQILNTFLDKISPFYLSLLTLTLLSQCAFTPKQRKIIKSSGVCARCEIQVGSRTLIAAHINHERDESYNRLENGIPHCKYCETEYHLMHAFAPQEIGLRRVDNDATIFGHMNELNEVQRNELISEYPEEWDRVCQRYY